MRLELFLAGRLMRDARTQSALITIGIAVGVAVVVFLSALIGGLQADLISKTVGSQAHVSIRPAEERPRALRAPDGRVVVRTVERVAQRVRSLDGWQAALARVRAMPGVAAAAPVVRGPGTAVRGAAGLNVVISGIDLDTYVRVVDLRSKVVAGELDTSARGVVLGARLADKLGVTVGDRIRLEAGVGERLIGEAFVVRGILALGNRAADETWAVVSLRNAQSLLDLSGGATELELAVRSLFEASSIAARIRAETGLDAESWMEINTELLAGLRSQSASSVLIQVFVLLAVAIGIASVLVVSVVQRKREIGILRAIGLTRRQAQRVFLLQGCLLAGYGAILGSGLGALLLHAFRAFVKNAEGAPLFPIDIDASLFVFAGGVAVATGLVAAVIPARSAARLDPVVAIRND